MTLESVSNSIVLIPFSADPLQRLTHHLLEHHAHQLPDLTSATILVPDVQVAPQLRRHLLDGAVQRGHTALLSPRILTLGEWLEQFPLNEQIVGQYGRELILIEALRAHQELFGAGSLWTLADALLDLFDELTLNQAGLPDDLLHFQRRIAQAYGRVADSHTAMEMETRLVHTLWHAWHAQLRESQQIDAATATLLRLRASLQTVHHAPLYLLDPCGRSRAEHEWLRALLERNQAVLFIQGELANSGKDESYLPDRWMRELLQDIAPATSEPGENTPLNRFLHSVYDPSEIPMRDRAVTFQRKCSESPLQG